MPLASASPPALSLLSLCLQRCVITLGEDTNLAQIAGVLEKPDFDRSQESSNALPDVYYGSTDNTGGKGLGGGDWR